MSQPINLDEYESSMASADALARDSQIAADAMALELRPRLDGLSEAHQVRMLDDRTLMLMLGVCFHYVGDASLRRAWGDPV